MDSLLDGVRNQQHVGATRPQPQPGTPLKFEEPL